MWGSHVGVHVATSSPHNLCCNSCIQHVGEGGRGPLTLPTTKFSFSLVNHGIGHLKASTNNCCEVQNGPVWFLYWHQSPFQTSDWLILHPSMKPRKICAARVEAPMWKCLANAFGWKRLEEARRRGKRSGWGVEPIFDMLIFCLKIILREKWLQVTQAKHRGRLVRQRPMSSRSLRLNLKPVLIIFQSETCNVYFTYKTFARNSSYPWPK